MAAPPTTGDVSEMDRLRRIMAGDVSEATRPIPQILPNGEEAITLSKSPSRKDVGSMADIMRNFSASTGVQSFTDLHDVGQKAVAALVEDSNSNRKLKQALITERTDEGLKIGAWVIKKDIREGLTSKEETVYHVRNTNTGNQIKAAFLIIESAKALVILLNNGATTDHHMIREIAEMEIKYRRMREKALAEKQLWRRAKKADNDFKMTLYEAKFDAAKSKALLLKERIKNIYYQL